MAKRMIIITVPAAATNDQKDVGLNLGLLKPRPLIRLNGNDDFTMMPKLETFATTGIASSENACPNFGLSSLHSSNNVKNSSLYIPLDVNLVPEERDRSPIRRAASHLSRADSYCSAGSAEFDSDEFEIENEEEISDFRTVPVRKRQRLNHLTPEEKMNRRKLKNRLAAHLARERRKAFMSELEREYRRLRFENDGLKSRNVQIKNDIQKLMEENDVIKTKIEEKKSSDSAEQSQQKQAPAVVDHVVGPAASINAPQQQARTWPATLLTSLLTLTASMIASSKCSANSSPSMDDIFGDARWPEVQTKIKQMKLDDRSRLLLAEKMERLKRMWNEQQKTTAILQT